MGKHISDQILTDVSFDPSRPIANLMEAKARVKNRYVLTQPQLEELVAGFERMARAYKNIILSEMEAAANAKKGTIRKPKSNGNGKITESPKLLTRKKKTDKRLGDYLRTPPFRWGGSWCRQVIGLLQTDRFKSC